MALRFREFLSKEAFEADKSAPAPTAKPTRPGWGVWLFVVLGATWSAVAIAVAVQNTAPGLWALTLWISLAGEMLLLTAAFGWRQKRARWGYAINAQNVVSLARIQYVVWLILLGATMVAVLILKLKGDDFLRLIGDPTVLGVLGIASGGTALAGGIAGAKSRIEPDPQQLRNTTNRLGRSFTKSYLQEAIQTLQTDSEKVAISFNMQREGRPPTEGPFSALANANVALRQKGAGSKANRVEAYQNQLYRSSLYVVLNEIAQLEPAQQAKGIEVLSRIARGADAGPIAKKLKFEGFEHLLAKVSPDEILAFSSDSAAAELLEDGQGVLYANRYPWDARLFDILEGNELADASDTSAGKAQLILVTVATMVMYVIAIVQAFGDSVPAGSVIPNELLATLGVSHGSYLGTKLPDVTKRL